MNNSSVHVGIHMRQVIMTLRWKCMKFKGNKVVSKSIFSYMYVCYIVKYNAFICIYIYMHMSAKHLQQITNLLSSKFKHILYLLSILL